MESIYKVPLVLTPQPEGGFTVTCPLVPGARDRGGDRQGGPCERFRCPGSGYRSLRGSRQTSPGGPAARAGRCADVARDCCCPGMKYREAPRGLRALGCVEIPRRAPGSQLGNRLGPLSRGCQGLTTASRLPKRVRRRRRFPAHGRGVRRQPALRASRTRQAHVPARKQRVRRRRLELPERSGDPVANGPAGIVQIHSLPPVQRPNLLVGMTDHLRPCPGYQVERRIVGAWEGRELARTRRPSPPRGPCTVGYPSSAGDRPPPG